MIYEIPEYKLAEIITTAAELGAKRALQEHGLIKSKVYQREAYRRHGAARVKRCREDGEVTPVKIVGEIYYNNNKLDLLTKINRLTNGPGPEEGGADDSDFQPGNDRAIKAPKRNLKPVEQY